MTTVNSPTGMRGAVATPALSRTEQGRLVLTHPTRGYKVTRNPFTVPAVLPGLVVATVLLEIAELSGIDPVVSIFDRVIDVGAMGYMIFCLGLLLVPAVALRGSLVLSHDGISFERGKQQMTAAWDQVTGIVWKRDTGMCLAFAGQEQSHERIRQPGGLMAVRGAEAYIPLRWFGDRQYSILYDVRDRLPEASWREAVERAGNRDPAKCLMVYGGVVALCSIAMAATAWAYS